jgi:hypothetical protein
MGHCYNSTIVNAPADKVWATLRKFHDFSWAKGVVEKCEPQGAMPPDKPGAQRVLNGAIHETLVSLDDQARVMTYSIDDGPVPLARDAMSRYVGRVRVAPVTENGSAFVEWESAYETKDDQAVAAFCDPIYRALLAALRAHFS